MTAVIDAMVGTPDATAFSKATPLFAIRSNVGIVARSYPIIHNDSHGDYRTSPIRHCGSRVYFLINRYKLFCHATPRIRSGPSLCPATHSLPLGRVV